MRESLPTATRPTPDFSMAEGVAGMVLPTIRKATQGRDNPRAPFVALEVITRGVQMPLRDAIRLERDRFLEVAGSSEAKAGMRFFFTQQRVSKLPSAFAKVTPRPIRRETVASSKAPFSRPSLLCLGSAHRAQNRGGCKAPSPGRCKAPSPGRGLCAGLPRPLATG